MMSQAILGYNHSPAYVRAALARARVYARAGDPATRHERRPADQRDRMRRQ